MTWTNDRSLALALAALLLVPGAGVLHAGLGTDLKADVEEAKHALGWDTINLTALKKDSSGRPTLERESNVENVVERRTSYQKSGNRDMQEVTVVSKESLKTLFTEKKAWNERGDLEKDDMQDDVYDPDGRQMKGTLVNRKFKDGRLMVELTKRYSANASEWGLPYKQTMRYFSDGDMRERITENPAGDEKTRETWSSKKGALGRSSTTARWNMPKKIWE